MSKDDVEFEQFGNVLAKLTANKEVFKNVVEAHQKLDAKRFQAELKKVGLWRYCRIICRWICVRRCFLFCRLVCIPPYDVGPDLKDIEEMQKLGTAEAKLMKDKEGMKVLLEAYEKEDVEKFRGILKKYELLPFCRYICQWLCTIRCQRVCYVVCTPLIRK